MKKRIISILLALVMTVGMIVAAVPASAAKAIFKDVTKGDWFYEYVNFVFERGIMKGTSNTTFGPDESMTRGQIVTILSRMSGDDVAGMASSMNFKDVNKSEYYADPIGWAVKNGIAKGMSAATFEPETPVLRQEFAAFFVRYMNYKGITIEGEGKVEPFPDKFPDWAAENIETLHKTGLVKGDAQGKFNPENKMTRAEIATVVKRFVEAVEAQEDATLEDIIEEYLSDNLCAAHHKLDFTFNYTGKNDYTDGSMTEENLKALLKSDIGLKDSVEITFDFDFETEIKEDYGGSAEAGAGGELPSRQVFCWSRPLQVTFTDTASGDTYSKKISFSLHKALPGVVVGDGRWANGARSLCPDDWDDYFHDAEDELEAF